MKDHSVSVVNNNDDFENNRLTSTDKTRPLGVLTSGIFQIFFSLGSGHYFIVSLVSTLLQGLYRRGQESLSYVQNSCMSVSYLLT